MVDRDTVDYRDTSSFDDSSLQDVQTIKSAILHKQYGKDVRSALTQLPDSLIKLFGDTGGNSNAEVEEARGGFETLGLHEQAQNAGIDKVTVEVQNARTNSSNQTYPTLKERMDNQENDLNNNINDKLAQISSVPETFANLAALQSKYSEGKTGLFVTADNGHKFIWNSGTWNDAGIYQAVGVADNSLQASKLTASAQNAGISQGVYFPLVKSNIVNNLKADPTTKPEQLATPLSISVSNADPTNIYILFKIHHDEVTNTYGAQFGYAPKIDDRTFDANQVVNLNFDSLTNIKPVVDQYGHVTTTYTFGELIITITYKVPEGSEPREIWFGDFYKKSYYYASIIDKSNYQYIPKTRGFLKNFNTDYPLVNYPVPGNTNSETKAATVEKHRKSVVAIKVVNPEPNTSYLIKSIHNEDDTHKYGAIFGKATRIDGQSFDTSTVTDFNQETSLSSVKLVPDKDGNVTFSVSVGKTTISITYNLNYIYTTNEFRVLYFYNGTQYYNLTLIDESNFINIPVISSGLHEVSYKRPTWLGDSITAVNSHASVHYHDILASEWSSTRSTNMGISGSTVGNLIQPMSVRYLDIPTDTDFISIFGGINDYGHDQPLGKYGDTTNTTFYGALYVLLKGIQTKFPTVPKIFISPQHIGDRFGGSFTSTTNGLGFSLDQYEKAIVEMTSKFSVPHLSLFDTMGVTFAVDAQADIYSVDSLHPNNAGHVIIADKVLKFLN